VNCKRNRILKKTILGFLFSCIIFHFISCTQPSQFKTENHILVVIDGVRFSEFWGDESRKNIPKLSKFLAPEGVLFTNVYNLGLTKLF